MMHILFYIVCIVGMIFGLCIIIASIAAQQRVKAIDISVSAKHDAISALLSKRKRV